MSRLVWLLLFFCIIAVSSAASTSDLQQYSKIKQLNITSEETPDVTAGAWGIVSIDTGKLIAGTDVTSTYPIASVTKLFTAVAARKSFDTLATTTITWGDVATEGRAGSLVPGDELSLHTLFFPLLLESSNDAAAALERSSVETSLMQAMNDYAAARNLHNTTFFDASGLSEKNISSVANLGTFSAWLHREQPHILDITRLESYLYQDYGWKNTSPFVSDPTYRGGKLGFTPEAGKTALLYFEETLPTSESYIVAYILLQSDDWIGDVALLRKHVATHGVAE